MKIQKALLISLLLVPALPALAQEERDADSLRHDFGRMSVLSARSTSTPYADTLDTENNGVKVVLYSNGT